MDCTWSWAQFTVAVLLYWVLVLLVVGLSAVAFMLVKQAVGKP